MAIELVDVQAVLLNSPDYGAAEIDRLRTAIAANQVGEMRQYTSELARKEQLSQRDLLALGITSYLLARHADADRFLAQLSGNGLAEYYHGLVLTTLNRFEDAAKAFEQASRAGHDSVVCTLLRAGVIRRQGKIDEADELLTAISREAATLAEYSHQKGCIFADRGDMLTAIEYFERAVDMDPRHTEALFRLANESSLLGNDEEAIKLYERSLARPPVYLGALINLGILYEDNENYAAAAFCFRRVLESDSTNERARLYLKDIESSSDMYYDEDADRRQRELDQVMQIPITDFELSARSRNCLDRAGIHSLGDLTRTSEQELLAGKNFGDTSLVEINAILESRGLRLGQELPQTVQADLPVFRDDDLSPQERALLEGPVSDLNLSVRSRKCLARLGIGTVGELCSRTADDMMAVRNFGVTSMNEIRAVLGEHGLKLRND
jgi:DNA-directed RNA polymerase subunit alpha